MPLRQRMAELGHTSLPTPQIVQIWGAWKIRPHQAAQSAKMQAHFAEAGKSAPSWASWPNPAVAVSARVNFTRGEEGECRDSRSLRGRC